MKASHIDKVVGNIDRSWNWTQIDQLHNKVRILVGWIPYLVKVQVVIVHL